MMFICDRTLGKLSKWLRILGFETLFLNIVNDDELISEVSKKKDSIFITRNLKIYSRIENENKLLLNADDFRSQLQEVSKFFPDNWVENLFTRCIQCGNTLESINRHEIKDTVPDYVYESGYELKNCTSCGKIYWSGTHINRITKELKVLFPNKIY